MDSAQTDSNIYIQLITAKNDYIKERSGSNPRFVHILRTYPIEEVFIHAYQLLDKTPFCFIFDDNGALKKSLCVFLNYICLPSIDDIDLIKLFPPVLKTRIDITDIFFGAEFYDDTEALFYLAAEDRNRYIINSLAKCKGQAIDYTIELTIPMYFLIILRFNEYIKPDAVYDYLIAQKIDLVSWLPILILHEIFFYYNDRHDIRCKIFEQILKKEIILSDLLMVIMFQHMPDESCKLDKLYRSPAKDILSRTNRWDLLCRAITVTEPNYKYLLKAIPITFIIFWCEFRFDLLTELWRLIIGNYSVADLRTDILEKQIYLS